MVHRTIHGGDLPPPLTRISLREVAARLGAIAYAMWGIWTLTVFCGLVLAPTDGGQVVQALMTLLAFQSIGVATLTLWRKKRTVFILNGIVVTCAQLAICVLAPYAWLPNGFVGPLLCAVGLVASLAAPVRKSNRRPTAQYWDHLRSAEKNA